MVYSPETARRTSLVVTSLDLVSRLGYHEAVIAWKQPIAIADMADPPIEADAPFLPIQCDFSSSANSDESSVGQADAEEDDPLGIFE
jgi:hypothetical protein